MKKGTVAIVVVGILGASIFNPALGSLCPAMDNVYGNTVTLDGGNQSIWNMSLTETSFIGTLYATDGQTVDEMDWTQNEANSRPLSFGRTNNWADTSLTHKFVAPTGKVFSGGTLTFHGTTYTVATLELYASSGYSNNGWGLVGPGYLGTIYSEDSHSPSGSWQWSDWVVNVPAGTSEFFVTVRMSQDYRTGFGNALYASGVTFTPEPATMGLLILGGIFGLRRRA